MEGLIIGIPQEYFPEELDESAIAPLRKLVERLEYAGATVVSVSLPATHCALSAYYVIASAEAGSNLARYSGIHYGELRSEYKFSSLFAYFPGLRITPPSEASKKKVSDVYSYTRSRGFGHEVGKRILLGTYALTAE